MNGTKPDTFVVVVAAMSEKMVALENERVELAAHIAADHAKLDDMQYTITDLRTQVEDMSVRLENTRYDNDTLRRDNRVLRDRQPSYDYYVERCAQLEQELLSLKFGGEKDPNKRASTYMKAEGEEVLRGGNKILCIKGVKTCTGWGLKEAKDYVEAYVPPPVLPVPELDLKEDSGPHTKPSQDMARKSA